MEINNKSVNNILVTLFKLHFKNQTKNKQSYLKNKKAFFCEFLGKTISASVSYDAKLSIKTDDKGGKIRSFSIRT